MDQPWEIVNKDWTNRYLLDFKKKWGNYQNGPRIMNDTLYKLFKKYPNHKNTGEIAAKVTILGRTYATGIERHAVKHKKLPPMNVITNFLVKNGKRIDKLFKPLIKIQERLTIKKLETVIKVHGDFVSLLSVIMRKNNNPRSFASKYMHFHCKAVPIFDQIANSSLKSKKYGMYPLNMPGMKRLIQRFNKPKDMDNEYYQFCVRFYAMYEDLKAHKVTETNVRSIDHYLLSD